MNDKEIFDCLEELNTVRKFAPFAPRKGILTKGKSYIETGFIYTPYVPLMVTDTIIKTNEK